MAVENNAVTEVPVRAGAAGPRFGYRLLYRLGFTPWDNNIVPMELAELVEGPSRCRRAVRSISAAGRARRQSTWLSTGGRSRG